MSAHDFEIFVVVLLLLHSLSLIFFQFWWREIILRSSKSLNIVSLRKIPKFHLISLCEDFVETHITWNYADTGVSTKFPQVKEGEILVFHAVFLTLLSMHLHVILKVCRSLKPLLQKPQEILPWSWWFLLRKLEDCFSNSLNPTCSCGLDNELIWHSNLLPKSFK